MRFADVRVGSLFAMPFGSNDYVLFRKIDERVAETKILTRMSSSILVRLEPDPQLNSCKSVELWFYPQQSNWVIM